MGIPELRRFRGHNRGGRFSDLPPVLRRTAEKWLFKLCQRWLHRNDLPGWRFAILCGQAKRLARTSFEERSKWGRSMHAKRGGYAVQRRYRDESRNPTARATHMSKCIRLSRKKRQEEAAERRRSGIPDPPRRGFAIGCNPWWD